MKYFVYILSLLSLFVSSSLIHAETLLVNLEPAEVVWGSFVVNDKIERTGDKENNMIVDYGGGNNWLYSGDKKIVKEIPKDYKFAEGQVYSAQNMEVFAVGGEFVTGVGILTRQFNMYYDITYNIPAGAKEFDAKLLVSDFAQHYTQPGAPLNQQGAFAIFIDEKEVYRTGIQRMSITQGSGENLDEIKFKIPDGAKKIRFNLESSPWGDQGGIELILNQAKFTP